MPPKKTRKGSRCPLERENWEPCVYILIIYSFSQYFYSILTRTNGFAQVIVASEFWILRAHGSLVNALQTPHQGKKAILDQCTQDELQYLLQF